MARPYCPYCYLPVDEMWFQCQGRGSPGWAGCARTTDMKRQELTGFSYESFPTFPPPRRLRPSATAQCPDCHGVTRVRACPNCHTPLPYGFGEGGSSPLICLVGAKEAGKTVYLTVLLHELAHSVGHRFGAAVQLGMSDPEHLRLQDEVTSLYERRQLPGTTQTAPGGRREPFVATWRAENRTWWRRRYRSSMLSFYDTAGEDLSSSDRAHDQRYLASAGALIVLVDPQTMPGVRDLILSPESRDGRTAPIDVLARVTAALRAGHGFRIDKRIPIPVAVVLTKMDVLLDTLGSDHPLMYQPGSGPYYDESAGSVTHEAARAFLHEVESDDIDAHLRLNFTTFRYFAVSSLGRPPDHLANTVSPHGIAPFRIEEPVTWLLSRFGLVPVRKD